MISSTSSVRCEEAADALRADDRGPDGPVVRGPAGDRPPGGGGRLRGLLPERPLRELPGRRRPADDGRLGDPRRPRARDVEDPARSAREPGHVPAPGQLREARHDRRPDERRAHRGRRRRRLERGGPRAAGARLPVDRGARGHARGPARAPARPVGGARRLGSTTGTRLGCAAARCGRGRSRSRGGPSRTGTPGRGSSPAARARPVAIASPRAGPTSSTCRPPRPRRPGEAGRARRGMPGDRPRPRNPDALGHGRGAPRPRLR